MWWNDFLIRGFVLAQSATPSPMVSPIPIKYEVIEQSTTTAGLTGIQWGMLILYAIICLGLIICVTAQTSKSEGLMQQMMGGAAPTYKGKKSTEDNLSSITNWMAFFFIGLSILMCLVFR